MTLTISKHAPQSCREERSLPWEVHRVCVLLRGRQHTQDLAWQWYFIGDIAHGFPIYKARASFHSTSRRCCAAGVSNLIFQKRTRGSERVAHRRAHSTYTHMHTSPPTHTREQAVLLLLTRVDGDPLTDLFSNFIYASVNPGRWGVNISQSKLSGKNCTLYFIHLKQNWLIEWHGKKYVILHLRA